MPDSEHQRFDDEEFENDAIAEELDALAGVVPEAEDETEPELEPASEPEVEAEAEPAGDPEPEPEAEITPEEISEEELVEEPEPEPEPEPDTEAEVELSELEELRAQNARLLEALNSGLTPSQPTPEPAPVVEAAPPQEPQYRVPTSPPAVAPPQLTDDLFDDIVSDRTKFESYMTEREAAIRQSTVQDMGGVFREAIQDHITVYDYFRQRPQLNPVRELVRRKAAELQTQNPEMKVAELLAKAAQELKEVTRIPEEAQQDQTILRPHKPATVQPAKKLATPKSRRPALGGSPVEKTLADEIEQMANL